MQKLEYQDFDDTEYKSQEDDQPDFRTLHRKARDSQKDSKTLTPAEINMTLSMKQGQELVEMMKNRGFQMNEAELKKMKAKQTENVKSTVAKGKAGFYDGGHSATLEELFAALNKAYNQNDTQQASCVLSYILERKELEKKDRNKFGLMKCNLLFKYDHGSYEECAKKAAQFLEEPFSDLSAAILSTYLARCKAELNRVWEGYMDLERAKSLLFELKLKKETDIAEDTNNDSEYLDTELDAVIRDLSTTEMEYSIRTNKQKILVNMLQPVHLQFKNRRIFGVSCGDHHAIFLVGGSYDEDIRKIEARGKWKTEVFGIGENAAGQVLGKVYDKTPCGNEPMLLKELSGKGIVGVYCTRESSMAYDSEGGIYEWGVKASSQSKQIEKTFSIGRPIQKLEKGVQHYAVLTESNQFYIWGEIQHKQKVIFAQKIPLQVKLAQSITDFSCGNNCIAAVTKDKQLFGLGGNEYGQLGSIENYAKQFSKINTSKLGRIQKVFCLGDCTFALIQDHELYYTGRYSYKKEPISNWKLGEFTDQIEQIISVSGYTGVYFITNQNGQIYRWNVDSSVKFRKHVEYEKWTPRIVECSRGREYRLKTLPDPQLCSARVLTKSLRTYTPILIEITLMDRLGIYGLELPQALKINVCLTKKEINTEDLILSSEKFIKLTGNKYTKNEVYLDEVIENNLLNYSINESGSSSKVLIEVMVEKANQYNLYILMNSIPIKGSPVRLDVEQSDKEAELEKKMIEERERKKRILEEKRQREEEARRLEEEQRQRELEKKKDTDKRAEEALRKHMREQEQQRLRNEQQRRRKAQLQTGGGFDLSKIKTKNSISQIKEAKQAAEVKQVKQPKQVKQVREGRNEEYRGSIPQLPDINVRPSSKRKLVLKKPEVPSVASNTLKSTLLKRADSKSKKPS